MRFFVAGAIYRARGALLRTIETVAGEKPLCVATSRIVTAEFFPLGRFTFWRSSGSIIRPDSPNLQRLQRSARGAYSAGTSNDNGLRNQLVFQMPKAMPTIIQMLPTTIALRLRLTHNARQITNPTTGGIRIHIFFSGGGTK